jgi:hypothetical protein
VAGHLPLLLRKDLALMSLAVCSGLKPACINKIIICHPNTSLYKQILHDSYVAFNTYRFPSCIIIECPNEASPYATILRFLFKATLNNSPSSPTGRRACV